MKTWFTAKASSDATAEIAIYDEIGVFGITSKDFHAELKALGNVKNIRLSINSPGGSVFDGLAIHNMLKRHKAKVTVTVDGVAASIASVIAMAGDEVLMPSNALMFVHDPSGVVAGNSRDMRELADALDMMKQSLISAYADKSGADREEIARMMEENTWLSAEEAVALGFADKVEEPVRMAASFNLSKFKNAPSALAGDAPRDPVAPHPAEEVSMTDEATAEATEEVVEAQATEEIATVVTEPEAEAVAETATAAALIPDTDAIVAQVREEERARSADIVAACALAGRPHAAAGFITTGKSLSDVLNSLRDDRAKNTPDISAHHSTSRDASAADWSKVIAKTNARVSG